MGIKWSEDDKRDLLEALQNASGRTFKERCRSLEGWRGRTFEAIKSKAQDLGYRKELDYSIRPGDDVTVLQLRDEVARLQKETERLKQFHKVFDEVALKSVAKLPKLQIKRPKLKANGEDQYVENLLLGDWQVGTKFGQGDVAGLADYDSEVIAKRVDELLDRYFLLHGYRQKAFPVNKVVIDLLGDFTEGVGIYPGQEHYIDQNAVDQIFYSAELLCKVIASLAEVYPKIEVFAVIGNHGRISKRHHRFDNYDYFLYRVLHERFKPYFSKKAEGINIYVSASTRMVYEIPEIPWMRHLIWHGDDVKASLSIPYYGVDRTVARSIQLFNLPIHLNKLGHWHRDAQASLPGFSRWVINGSLVGGSPYSVEQLATAAPASQTLLLLHERVGVRAVEQLYVEDRKEFLPDERGIYTPTIN